MPDRLDQSTDERGMQMLAALMDQLGLQRASIVGHAMGGRPAWRFAASQPQRVHKLVLQPPGPVLARITAPTLLLWGQADATIPVAHAADDQRAMPQARLVVLPGVGHPPQEEASAPSLAEAAASLQG